MTACPVPSREREMAAAAGDSESEAPLFIAFRGGGDAAQVTAAPLALSASYGYLVTGSARCRRRAEAIHTASRVAVMPASAPRAANGSCASVELASRIWVLRRTVAAAPAEADERSRDVALVESVTRW